MGEIFSDSAGVSNSDMIKIQGDKKVKTVKVAVMERVCRVEVRSLICPIKLEISCFIA